MRWILKPKNHFIIFTILFLQYAMLLSASAYSQEPKQSSSKASNFKLKMDYKIGVAILSDAGTSASQIYDGITSVSDLFKNEYGYDIAIEKYSSTATVKDDFLNNKLDMGAFFPNEIVELIDAGGKVYPGPTYTVNDNRKVGLCLYAHSESGITDVNDIRGKNILMPRYNSLEIIQLRNFLKSKGIDEPLYNVFNSFIKISSTNSAYLALSMGDVDLIWGNTDTPYMLAIINSNIGSKVKKVVCTEDIYARSAILLNKNTIDKASYDAIIKAFKNNVSNLKTFSNSSPSLQAVYRYLKMTKARITITTEDEFDAEIELYRKARKSGWLDEAKLIVEKVAEAPKGEPVKIKMDYKACKNSCSKYVDMETEYYKCIDECLK